MIINELVHSKFKFSKDGKRERCRATFYFADGSSQRLSGSGKPSKSHKECIQAILEKAEIEQDKIIYGQKVANGEITLAEAVLNELKLKKDQYDVTRKKQKVVDETIEMVERACKTFIIDAEIGKKQVNMLFKPELMVWRNSLSKEMYEIHRMTESQIASYNRAEKKAMAAKTKEEADAILFGLKRPEFRHYSASYINRAIRVVKDVVNKLYENSKDPSPAANLSIYKVVAEAKTEDDFLIGEEFPQFVRFLMTKYRTKYPYNRRRKILVPVYAALFLVSMATGIRPGEALALRKRDFDPETETLYIQRTGEHEDGRTKTKNSEDFVPVASFGLTVLNELCAVKNDDDLLFPNLAGELLSRGNTNNLLKKWLAEAGINKKLHPHSFRGSLAVYIIDNYNGPTEEAIERAADILRDEPATVRKYYYTLTQRSKDEKIERKKEIMRNLKF